MTPRLSTRRVRLAGDGGWASLAGGFGQVVSHDARGVFDDGVDDLVGLAAAGGPESAGRE